MTVETIRKMLDGGEQGDALLFSELTQGNILFDHSKNSWYLFNGNYWEQDTTNSVRGILSNTLRDKYYSYIKLIDHQQNEKLSKRLSAHIHALGFGTRIKSTLSLAETPCAFTGEWDTIPHKIAVKNGVINLQTGKLETGNKTDYLNYCIPVEYDAGADCPRFKQFLQEVFDNDQETIDFIKNLFGYGLIGASYEHIFPVFYGPDGFNGKDTLLKTLRNVLGSGICNAVSSDILIDTKNFQNTTSAAYQLEGLHIAYTSESADGAILRSEQVKNLTGDSPLPVKKLYKDVYTITPKHLLLLLTNFKPSADSVDSALWQRIVLIEFNQRFVPEPIMDNEHKIDTNLSAKLRLESPGILNWLVQGAVNYYDNGLHIPEKLQLSTLEYREQNDTIGQFIADYCTVGDGLKVLQSELYARFTEIYGSKIKQREFVKAVEKHGFTRKKMTNGQTFFGLYAGKPIESEFDALDKLVGWDGNDENMTK